jgi:hypothetical protein
MARYPDPSGLEGMSGYPPPYGQIPGGPGGPPPRNTLGPSHRHDGERKRSSSRASVDSSRSEGSDEDLDDDEENDAGVSSRLRTYIKPRIPSTQEVLDRRARKNAQSRARAAKLRQRIAEIELKPEDNRTEEEGHLWAQYEQRRQRKNNRSRERALEKKEEIDRIISKADKKRSKIEKQFLETALSAKKRKNEGDRLRRQRLKELGLSTKGTGVKPGISARGPLPPQYQHLSQPTFGRMMHSSGHHGMSDIPMSPLPSMPHHHAHHMQSPGFGSPGMMPSLSFPSPSHARHGGTPGRHSMPYMQPPHTYDGQMPSPSRGHSHPSGSQVVEQRRHADGSISFSIDGRGSSTGNSRGESQRGGGAAQHQSSESDLLLDHDGYGQIDDSNADGDERDTGSKCDEL